MALLELQDVHELLRAKFHDPGRTSVACRYMASAIGGNGLMLYAPALFRYLYYRDVVAPSKRRKLFLSAQRNHG
jgi:hypothetical protein